MIIVDDIVSLQDKFNYNYIHEHDVHRHEQDRLVDLYNVNELPVEELTYILTTTTR